MEKPQILVHLQEEVPYTIFDVLWYPGSAKLASLGSRPQGTGIVELFEINNGSLDKVSSASLPNAVKCGTFGASPLLDRKLIVGDFKGKLSVVDLEKMQVVDSVGAHEEIVNCLDGFGGLDGEGKGPPEVVTSSRDGCVKVWDIRVLNEGPVAVFSPSESKRDCWAVCFGDCHSSADRSVLAGFDNGDLKLFDLRKACLRYETSLPNGIVSVEFDRPGIEANKFVATTLEGGMTVFDARTLHPEKGFAFLTEKAFSATVWSARHSPHDRDVFAACGGNGAISLYKYNYPEKRKEKDEDGLEFGIPGSLQKLQSTKVSSQPINAFRWNPDLRGLAACASFDQALRVLIVTKLATV